LTIKVYNLMEYTPTI